MEWKHYRGLAREFNDKLIIFLFFSFFYRKFVNQEFDDILFADFLNNWRQLFTSHEAEQSSNDSPTLGEKMNEPVVSGNFISIRPLITNSRLCIRGWISSKEPRLRMERPRSHDRRFKSIIILVTVMAMQYYIHRLSKNSRAACFRTSCNTDSILLDWHQK